MKVRKLTAEDYLLYKTIRLESLLKDPNAFGSTYEYDSVQADNYWQNTLNSYHIFGLFDDEKIIGCVGLEIPTMERFKHTAKLWGMYVSEEYRGKGLAFKLIEELVNYAKSNEILQIHLSCMKVNEIAINFYNKLGFQLYGIMPKAVKIGGEYFDDCLMIKEI